MKTSQRLNLRQHSRWIQLTFCLFLIFTFTTPTRFGQVRAQDADGEMGLETNPVLQKEIGNSTYEDIGQPEVIRPLAGIQHEPIGVDEQVLNSLSMQDAASALFGWTHDGPLDEWEWGKVFNSRITGIAGNDRGYCWGTKMDEDYSPSSNGNLYSPIIAIPGDAIGTATVEWNQYYNVEGSFDYARAHYRCDGGNWILMDEWTGPLGTSWQSQAFTTSCSPGQTIELRYQLEADDYDFKNYAGYYIDDVLITDSASTAIYAESFKPFGWTTDGIDYGYDYFADEWEWGTPTYTPGPTGCNNGDYCWGTDLNDVYNSYAKDELFSPQIDIPNTGVQLPIKVNWYQAWYLASNPGGMLEPNTNAQAHYTCDGGVTWTLMWKNTNTTSTVSQPWQNVPSGPYSTTCTAGQTLQLRFLLDRDTTDYAGYFIDDVTITDSSPAPVTIYYQGFELPAGNQPPVVNAGEDQVIATDTTTLTGNVIDDGLPGPLTITWSKVSGPGSVGFGDYSSPTSTATFSTTGLYVLRLTANDGEIESFDDVEIIYNEPPVVNAGEDRTIFTSLFTLTGTASDDGYPEPLTTTWSAIGQTCPNIVSPNELLTDVYLTTCAFGTYKFRLTAYDGLSEVYDEVIITYSQGNQAPVVDTGPDRTVSTATIDITAYVNDDGLPNPPGTLTTLWTQTSGPGTVAFGDANIVNTTVTFPAEGIYVLRLTADDSSLSSYDEIQITYSTTGHGIARILPLSVETSLCLDSTQVQTLQVCNAGGGFMNWSLSEETNLSWLDQSSLSGTLGGGGCKNISLTFDSAGKPSGSHYTGNLIISTEDFYETEIAIPVTLNVVGAQASGICVAPQTLDVKSCAPTDQRKLQICNTGTSNLTWNLSEDPSLDWLNQYPWNGTLPTGQCQDIDLTFSTSFVSPGSHAGTLLLNSDHPTLPQIQVPVTLTLPGPKTWTGYAGSYDWFNPLNWSPQGVPAVEWNQPWEGLTGMDYLLCEGNAILSTGSTVSLGTDPAQASTAHDLTIESNARLYGGSKTLHISGDWINSGTFDGNQGTVEFRYLTQMSGGGVNNFNFLEIGRLQNLNAGAETIHIAGSLTTRGYFHPGTSTTTFSGADQWLNCPNGTITFNDLTIEGGLRVNCLYSPIQVNNALVINPGASFDLRDNKISYGSLAYIDGTLLNNEREFLTGEEINATFYDARNQPAVELRGLTTLKPPGDTYVETGIGSTNPAIWSCGTNPEAVKRHFAIQPSGLSFDVMTVRLYYEDAELNGNAEDALGLMRCGENQWIGVPGTYTRDTTANYVLVEGVEYPSARYILSDNVPILDTPPDPSDGTVTEGEYGGDSYESPGEEAGGSSLQNVINQSGTSTTWYATWDMNNLYLAASGNFSPTTDALNLYLDFDPTQPVNGGDDGWGSLLGPGLDDINTQLPFRADFYAYIKDGTTICKRADGAGSWVDCASPTGIIFSFGTVVTEVTIPWRAITGSGWPASFNWFGYISSDNGVTNRAFAHAPKENPSINGSSTPLDLYISHYFSVPHVGKYNTTGQFSHNSFTHLAGEFINFEPFDVFNFTINGPGATITLSDTPGTWNILNSLVVGDGTLNLGLTNRELNLTGPLFIGDSGSIAGEAALTLVSAGVKVTNNGAVTAANVIFDAVGDQYLDGSGTWQSLTIGEINAPTVHTAPGMALNALNLAVNSTLQLSSGDLTLPMANSLISVPTGGNLISTSQGNVHLQGPLNLSVLGTWSAPTMIDSGAVSISGTGNLILGDLTISAGSLDVPSGTSLSLSGNVTVNSGAQITGSPTSLNFNGVGKTVTNNGFVNSSNTYFYGNGIQYLAGNGTWFTCQIQNKSILYPAPGMTLTTYNLIISSGGELALSNNDLTLIGAYGGTITIRGWLGGKVTSTGGKVILQSNAKLFSLGSWSAPVFVISGTTEMFNNTSSVLGSDLTISSGSTLKIPKSHSLVVNGTVINNGTLEHTKAVVTDNTAFLNISTNHFGIEIDPTGETGMGDTTVRIKGNQFCENADFGIKRCFDITPTTPQTADIKFYFTEAERNEEVLDNLMVLHWEEDNWYALDGTPTRGGSGDAQWVSISGVDAYSPFILASTDPTSVTFLFFTAARTNEAGTLNWETASEIDLLGFNLYRATSPDGERVKLNAEVIPINGPGSVIGSTYAYIDTDVFRDLIYYYWLEGLDLSLRVKEVVGPVEARVTFRLFIPLFSTGN